MSTLSKDKTKQKYFHVEKIPESGTIHLLLRSSDHGDSSMGKSRNKNKGGISGPRVNPIAVAANGAPKVESDEEALNQIYSELTAGMH